MADKAKPIPDGYHSITPYLTIKGAAKAIEFYKKVFGAEIIRRLDLPGDKIMHAEIKIGDSTIMLADEFPEMNCKSPESIGGTSVQLHFYTEDVDELVDLAVAEGAELKRPVQNQFYGDRSASLIDPFGHAWYVATHIEDIAEDEIQRRAEMMMKEYAGKENPA
jgi:PhnB protein